MIRLIPSRPGRLAAGLIILFTLLLLCIGCGSAGQQPATSSSTTAEARPDNHNPVVDKIIPEYAAIERDGSGGIKCIAHDPDGDELTYKWEASRGNVSGDGPDATYTAPSSYVDIIITVKVSDGMSVAIAQASFPVVCCGYAQENPEWIE